MARWHPGISAPAWGASPENPLAARPAHCPALCSSALSLASVWSCPYVDLFIWQNSSLLFRARCLATATVSPNREKKAKTEKKPEIGSNFPFIRPHPAPGLLCARTGLWRRVRGGWKPHSASQCWHRHSSVSRGVTGAALSPRAVPLSPSSEAAVDGR